MLYLDAAATTPVHPQVLEAMLPYFTEHYANASSLHEPGQVAKEAVETARQQIADYLKTSAQQVTFTSGGTESDNLAILGVLRALKAGGKLNGRGLVVSATEHSAVLEAARYAARYEGIPLVELAPDAQGCIPPEKLAAALDDFPAALVSIMHVNNETGAKNDVEALAKVAHQHGALFHTDAVQAFAKFPLIINHKSAVDYYSATAHKCGGPKGVGFFWRAENAPIPHPVIMGGGQEKGLRGGTLNTPAIVGFGKAVELLQSEAHREKLKALEASTQALLEALNPLEAQGLHLNTPKNPAKRAPGIVNVSIPGQTGDALVLHFDMREMAASSGSACHAEALTPSHVVLAQTQDDARARATLRFSFDEPLTAETIETLSRLITNKLPKT